PIPPAISGGAIAAALGMDVDNVFSRLELFYPNASQLNAASPQSSLNQLMLQPQGYFAVQAAFDNKYVLTTVAAAERLFGKPKALSSIEIKLKEAASPKKVIHQMQDLLGKDFEGLNRLEQNKTLFLIMKGEKWAVYAIFLLVLIIASFNMIGSLSMLVLEKKKDITMLKTMGATASLIRTVFLASGLLLALVG